ncbi:hypothetical protein PhaeoP83_04208 (plasmid) [Phaeobacter inhibens]|nr:hypothetical protein PhaeoP83_04208 [Phaeobacter inhibens]AUR22231.1 hypothetical protein PhaeoP80_04208 [Phaeobacter inhibens]
MAATVFSVWFFNPSSKSGVTDIRAAPAIRHSEEIRSLDCSAADNTTPAPIECPTRQTFSRPSASMNLNTAEP